MFGVGPGMKSLPFGATNIRGCSWERFRLFDVVMGAMIALGTNFQPPPAGSKISPVPLLPDLRLPPSVKTRPSGSVTDAAYQRFSFIFAWAVQLLVDGSYVLVLLTTAPPPAARIRPSARRAVPGQNMSCDVLVTIVCTPCIRLGSKSR